MSHKHKTEPSSQAEPTVATGREDATKAAREKAAEKAQKIVESAAQVDLEGTSVTDEPGAEPTDTAGDQEKAALQEQLLRARAEVENMRRRAERDVANAHKYALERFVDELLPVLDSLDQGQTHSFANEEAKRIHEGVALTTTMFLTVLKKFGVECIDPLHDKFDPKQHEAMSVAERQDLEPNTVTQVLQKGYLLNGRLIRPARVFISRGTQA